MRYHSAIPPLLTVFFAAGAGIYAALDDCAFPQNYAPGIVSATLAWGAIGLAIGLLAGVVANSRLRFTIRDIALATFWVAVCCLVWRVENYLLHHQEHAYPIYLYLAVFSLKYAPIPAAIGELFGRFWFGLAIGLGLFLFWFGLALVLIYGNFVFI